MTSSNQAYFKSEHSAPPREKGVKKRKGEERGMPNRQGMLRGRDRWGSESEGTSGKKGGKEVYKTQRNIFETGSPQHHRSTVTKLDQTSES